MRFKQILSLLVLFTILILVRSSPIQGLTATIPTWTNISTNVGLSDIHAIRLASADVNGDGYPDLILHQKANEAVGDVLEKQFLYLNLPGTDPNNPFSRQFVDYTAVSNIRQSNVTAPNGRHSSLAIFADVDNDGDLDMFSGVYLNYPENYTDLGDRNGIFLNNGIGQFSPIPAGITFIEDGLLNTAAATFLDYNLDGFIDLFIGNWWDTLTPNASIRTESISEQLYMGNGDGTFENVTKEAGLLFEQPTYAAAASDVNNDGLMDLFASNYCQNQSVHWQNNGDGTFTQVQSTSHFGEIVGVPLSLNPIFKSCSWGSLPRDYDNDGDIDFFELIVHGSNVDMHSTVLTNENGVFTWDMNQFTRPDDNLINHYRDYTGGWIDVDNDGLTDFILSKCCKSGDTVNLVSLFQQDDLHQFNDITTQTNLHSNNTAALPVIAILPFDFDLDGDEDVLMGLDNEQSIQLWRNDGNSGNNWLAISLMGAGLPNHSNKNAIGARVELTVANEMYMREVYAGNGHFGSQAPLRLTFGVGQATIINKIKVIWPNKNRCYTELFHVPANLHLRIEESSESWTGCLGTPNGLLSYWPGEGNADDVKGVNHGIVNDNAAFAPGKVRQTFIFDGDGDFVSIPFSQSFNFQGSEQFTISGWVKPQRLDTFQAIMVKAAPPTDAWDWGVYIDDQNRLMAGLHLQEVVQSNTAVSTDQWTHFAVTYKNGEWVLYVNGQQEDHQSGILIAQSNGGLALGRKGESTFHDDFLQGMIDEVRLFNYALSSSEISGYFHAEKNERIFIPWLIKN